MLDWIETSVALHGKGQAFVIITQLSVQGSTPREPGAKMVVSADNSYYSLGGGHLEYKAIAFARQLLHNRQLNPQVQRYILGAELGQCCGGVSMLLFEPFYTNSLNIILFGAGHVGRAVMAILSPLPCTLTWVDSRAEMFPDTLPGNVTTVTCAQPQDEVAGMPADAYYIVMTHSHPQDFDICSAVLKRADHRYLGLIGSKSKWLKFEKKFLQRALNKDLIKAMHCPIGLGQVGGKAPQEIAIATAAQLLSIVHSQDNKKAVEPAMAIDWQDLV